MHKPIYQAMVEAAKAAGILAYSDIAPLAGHRLKLGAILMSEINRVHKQWKP